MATEADYYFAAGDLSNFGRGLDRCASLMQQRAEKMWVLPGNHESAAQIDAFCGAHGFHSFHGKSIEIAGHHVAGLGYSCPTPFNTPGEYSEAEMAQRLEPFAALAPLVLICHCPPQGTAADRASEGKHFGSTAVRDFIRQHQPRYCFCGHIHEAEGASGQLGATHVSNVGQRGYLLEL